MFIDLGKGKFKSLHISILFRISLNGLNCFSHFKLWRLFNEFESIFKKLDELKSSSDGILPSIQEVIILPLLLEK